MFQSTDTILIGVDGGGTGCRVALGTAAQGVLARATGGPANATTQADVFLTNVQNAMSEAAKEAEIPQDRLRSAVAHVGLAGVMTDAQSSEISTALNLAKCRVTDDRFTTLTGALGGQDGYVVSVGTGTIIAAISNGCMKSVGGWGFHLSDQASGAWLGRGLLEQVLMCHDGVQSHSDLTRDILSQFGRVAANIVSFSATAKPADYAALAPAIVAAERNGDPVAAALMQGGVDYILASLKALGYQPGDPLCVTGGLGPSFMVVLPSEAPFMYMKPKGSALDGAFQLAMDLAKGNAT